MVGWGVWWAGGYGGLGGMVGGGGMVGWGDGRLGGW